MITLTVYFDDPWWVGVVVCDDAGTTRAYRHVFGAEPSGEEVLAFVLRELIPLTSRPVAGVAAEAEPPRRPNPKRAAREAARLTAERGISTKAQEALRVAREAEGAARLAQVRDERRRSEEERRAQARARARERHRGR